MSATPLTSWCSFGEYRGLTLFQVAQVDPDYIRSLALTAQRPRRAAALQVVRALEASERPALDADRQDRVRTSRRVNSRNSMERTECVCVSR